MKPVIPGEKGFSLVTMDGIQEHILEFDDAGQPVGMSPVFLQGTNYLELTKGENITYNNQAIVGRSNDSLLELKLGELYPRVYDGRVDVELGRFKTTLADYQAPEIIRSKDLEVEPVDVGHNRFLKPTFDGKPVEVINPGPHGYLVLSEGEIGSGGAGRFFWMNEHGQELRNGAYMMSLDRSQNFKFNIHSGLKSEPFASYTQSFNRDVTNRLADGGKVIYRQGTELNFYSNRWQGWAGRDEKTRKGWKEFRSFHGMVGEDEMVPGSRMVGWRRVLGRQTIGEGINERPLSRIEFYPGAPTRLLHFEGSSRHNLPESSIMGNFGLLVSTLVKDARGEWIEGNFLSLEDSPSFKMKPGTEDRLAYIAVSYTHLTLPTN